MQTRHMKEHCRRCRAAAVEDIEGMVEAKLQSAHPYNSRANMQLAQSNKELTTRNIELEGLCNDLR